jgi:N-acetylneuraminate synthase/N,N'-diacetyllegionaminate synthase
VCSTDDPAIAMAAKAWGAEVIDRPAALATAVATSVDVALHALDAVGEAGAAGKFETLVLVQPTSPLVEPADIIAVVERHRGARGAPVTIVAKSHPAAWHRGMGPAGMLTVLRGAPGTDVLLAGGCFAITPTELRVVRGFVPPARTLGQPIPAARAVDVDEEEDLLLAEALLSARPVRRVPIGERVIGEGPVYVIAEGGVNHNGDPALARRLVEAAAEAGADAVKFQTFDPHALAAVGAPTAAYQRTSGVAEGDQQELLRKLVLPGSAWADLQEHARARDLVFLSTPFDDASAALLDDLGVPAFKVGSGELTNLPFIARLARRGRPLLVSTGMADMVEVAAVVDTVRAAGDVPLALFHCVSSYPAAPADANVRAIETMRRAFALPVGWSDHTRGIELPMAAVAVGAQIVEKHLTLDRRLPGPDHAASLEPGEFREMVAGIRAIEAALGNGVKAPVAAEQDVARVARRSLHWRRSLPPGATIGSGDLEILRPATGLAPANLDDVVGRRTARAVEAGQAVDAGDVDGLS